MGLYNFQSRFVPFIVSGKKTHTIRARRAHPDKAGNTLHLYQGLRTKAAKLIKRVECAGVQQILIWQSKYDSRFLVRIDGDLLDNSECEQLARRDGFKDFREMVAFWDGRLPFEGQIIHWRELP